MSINATKWTFLVVVVVCRCLTSFHSWSTAAFAFGINIAWGERSFIHTSRFPEASISERHISRIVWTILNSRSPNIHILFLCTPPAFVCTPEIRRAEQHLKFVLLFFPSSHLRVSRTSRIFRVYLKNLVSQIRCARDETTCACFHPQRKLGEELSWDLFIGTNSCTKVVTLHWIPSFPCNINTNEFFLQTLRLLLFWNNGFPYACSGLRSFAWNSRFSIHLLLFLSSLSCFHNSRQCVKPYMIWTWCRLNFDQSPLGLFYPFKKSFVQKYKSYEIQSMNLIDCCSHRHPNNHKFVFSRAFSILLRGIENDSFLGTCNWTSRFKMITMKFFPSFCVSPEILIDTFVIFCFFRLNLFPIAMRFSAEILSPHGGFPSQSGFLEFEVSSW